ncbi:MAG: glycosyltransferase family 4 protein [Nitrososphaerales archaeon]
MQVTSIIEKGRGINCLLVSGLDPLTRHLRTGAALRFHNPPRNVSYILHNERLGYPKYLGHYGLGWLSVPLSAARLFTEAFFPLEKEDYSLIHSLFWSIHRYPLPWIHENDQSLGQYFSDYVKFEGFVKRKIVGVAADMLNSNNCKAVIVWSNWAKKGYINDGVDQGKVNVIPPAFTTSRKKIKHDSTNLLFIGRDYNRKGGDVALKVFENLKKSHDNIHFTFVGRIEDKEMLEKVKHDERISYFDHVSKSDLREKIFPTSDVFILPTIAEAYGMSIIEAMSNGIPVIASNISAIPEVVQDGVSGYLVPPSSVESFTRRSAELLDNKEKRETMGKNALEKVERAFSPEKIGGKLYDLYLGCLS